MWWFYNYIKPIDFGIENIWISSILVKNGAEGIYSSMESCGKLVTAYLIKYSEEWSVGKGYIQAESIELCRVRLCMTA
jgi:hypothetical protein